MGAVLERMKRLGGRTALAIGIAVSAGLAVGVLLVPRSPSPGDDRAPLPATTLLGKTLALDEQAQKVALARARGYLAGKFRLDVPGGGRREVYLGQFGAELDRVHLSTLVRDARDRTSALVRVHRASAATGPLSLPLPVMLDRELSTATLLRLKDELDRLPVDARLDLEKRELVQETFGRWLDVDLSLLAIEAALARGEPSAKLVFRERRPKRLAKELGNVEFGHVLGFFETRYDRSERQEARTYNLRLAASRLDGTVLLPGETFDFNGVVGPRDEASGYKVAPVIAQGELVDGIGGGTCQISGTLHGAAFFAGLEIVERYPHTRPSAYIKMGLDATVVYPTINFRVRNPFEFPVVLHQSVKNGIVRAEILGPRRTRTVTLIRRILEALPYEEVERPDKALPRGERVLGQRGVAGFKLRRYRIVREGVHAIRDRWDDVYPPTTQIIRVGTGESVDASRNSAEHDPHSEYVADELLVVTQGIDAEEDGTESTAHETREPGRFGEAGWTEAAGMPWFRSPSPSAPEPVGNDVKNKQKSGEKS